MAMRAPYKESETGTAKGAAQGRMVQMRPAPMPHHIVKVTIGPAAIEAGMPANCI
jgi:hypothetical protein